MENYSKRELNLMKFNIKDIYLDFIKMENKSHIENKYKLNIFYIRSYLLKNGYKVKTFLEIKNKRIDDTIIEMWNNGDSIKTIMKKLNVKEDSIYNRLKKNNINYLSKKNISIDNIKKEYEDEVFLLLKDGKYAISNYGRVYSFITNIFMKVQIKKYGKNKGYCSYWLNKKYFSAHRLVAEYFIPNLNPKEFTEVNHLDSNRENNKWSNLEWCNRNINVKHSILSNEDNYNKAVERSYMAGMKNAKKVRCIEDDIVFNSISDAGRYYGIKHIELIVRVCSKKNNYTKDIKGRRIKFEYIGEE
jgi:hypothetical protein